MIEFKNLSSVEMVGLTDFLFYFNLVSSHNLFDQIL